MHGDARGHRIAVVSDTVVNGPGGLLELIASHDFGVVQLPPATLPAQAVDGWIESVIDHVEEFRRHGYTIVAVLDAGDPAAAAVAELSLPTCTSLDRPGEVARFLTGA